MLVKIEEFVEQIVYTGGKKPDTIIGSAIKQARTKRDMTLEEVCKDICCLAYLSKLERNQINNVKNKFVPKICERLDINYNDICAISNDDTFKEVIRSLISNKIQELYERVSLLNKSIYYATDELCKALVALLSGDLSEFNRKMIEIDAVKSSLTTDEVIFMLFVMIQYYYRTNQFISCHNYLLLIERFEIVDVNMKILLQEIKFYTESNLSHSSYKYEYLKLKSYFDYNCPVERQIKAKYQMLINENEEDSLAKLELIDYGNLNCKAEYVYAKAYLLINHEKVKEGLDLLIEYNSHSVKYIALYAYGVLLYKKVAKSRKQVVEYFKLIDKFLDEAIESIEDNIHLTFIDLMKLEFEENDEVVICDYIKYTFLDKYKTYQYYPYSRYIDCRYYYLMGLLSRYKDAYNYSLKSENIVKNTAFYSMINDVKKKK